MCPLFPLADIFRIFCNSHLELEIQNCGPLARDCPFMYVYPYAPETTLLESPGDPVSGSSPEQSVSGDLCCFQVLAQMQDYLRGHGEGTWQKNAERIDKRNKFYL